MSTGTIFFIAFAAVASLVALGLMFAAVVKHLQTSNMNACGQASDTERTQTGRTAIAVSVGAAILLAFFAFGLPLAKHLGNGLDADPAEETSTAPATPEPAQDEE